MVQTPILLVRQRHDADRAGLHYDWRVVIGDKAHSWATKKEVPPPMGKLILWEQPIHDREYATSERIEIPKGQYGAGVTTLDYAQKGTGNIEQGDHFELNLNNGDRFYIKKMPSYGEKAWLMINLTKVEKKAEMSNPYLEKLASMGKVVNRLVGTRAKTLDKVRNNVKYKASFAKTPEEQARYKRMTDRLDVRHDRALKDTEEARKYIPHSLVEGAAKAVPGALIGGVSGYILGKRKEKQEEKAGAK